MDYNAPNNSNPMVPYAQQQWNFNHYPAYLYNNEERYEPYHFNGSPADARFDRHHLPNQPFPPMHGNDMRMNSRPQPFPKEEIKNIHYGGAPGSSKSFKNRRPDYSKNPPYRDWYKYKNPGGSSTGGYDRKNKREGWASGRNENTQTSQNNQTHQASRRSKSRSKTPDFDNDEKCHICNKARSLNDRCTALCYDHFKTKCNTNNCHYIHNLNKGIRIAFQFITYDETRTVVVGTLMDEYINLPPTVALELDEGDRDIIEKDKILLFTYKRNYNNILMGSSSLLVGYN